jgi:DNA-binding Xre family transcriptional regulator
VHKQDTARLNAETIGDLIREGGHKQYMVARQIGVDPLTVNRWLTGKVKRISRDNLDKLAAVLQCSVERISHADEADVRATRVEQSQAAALLVEPRARQMFELTGDFAMYEQLLKAVMHPNMSVGELCEIYNQLTIAASRQNKQAQAREYAELTLDYAQRCGDTDREFSARCNIAASHGESGLLSLAVEELEQVIAFAESVGNLRGRAVAGVNLIHAYRLQADWEGAVRIAVDCVPRLRQLNHPMALIQAQNNAAAVSRDLGQFPLFRELIETPVPGLVLSPRNLATLPMLLAEADSLEGNCESAQVLLRSCYTDVLAAGRLMEDYHVSCASTFRRCGDLAAAQQHIDWALAQDWLSPYDHPFLHAEGARIAAAGNDHVAARRLRMQANAEFTALGMARWVCDDPAIEIGRQFPDAAVQLDSALLY